MTFDNRNRGALFKAEKKEAVNARDYSGNLNVEGVEYWISGWVKVGKGGQKFLSLSITPKTPAARAADAKADADLF